MLTNEGRKQILISILEIISNISDKEYQKRVWIRGEGPEVDDFDETCCNFFGDVDPLLENYKDFGLTESQYILLKTFRDNFRVFSDKYYHPFEFIDTLEWRKITEMAECMLNIFNYEGIPQSVKNLGLRHAKTCNAAHISLEGIVNDTLKP